MLHGDGDHQTPDEHHVRFFEIAQRCLVRIQDSHEREKYHGDESGYRERKNFSHPVTGHQEHHVKATECGSVVLKENREEDEGIDHHEDGSPVYPKRVAY